MRDERKDEAQAKANGIIVTARADMRVVGVEMRRRAIPIGSHHPLDPDPWNRRTLPIEAPPDPGPDLPTITPTPGPVRARRNWWVDQGWPGTPQDGRRDRR